MKTLCRALVVTLCASSLAFAAEKTPPSSTTTEKTTDAKTGNTATGTKTEATTGTKSETATKESKTEGTMDETSDAAVLSNLHHANTMEIEMAKMAKSHASSKAVKDFASKMVTDHSKADKEVMTFAKSNKISLAKTEKQTDEMKQHKDMMDRLKGMKGADFDKEFMTAMADDHSKVVSDVTTARDAHKDDKLGKMLDKLLPTLKEHEEMATKVKDEVSK